MPLSTMRRGSISSHAKFFFFVSKRVNIPFPPATSAIFRIVLPYCAAMKICNDFKSLWITVYQVLSSTHFRFSGFNASNAGWTNRPSFRTRVPSKNISPPPCSGVWIITHIPMDSGPISVIRFLISLTGCEVKRACNLLIEQDIQHRICNVRIECDRKLSDIARAFVGIKDSVKSFGVIRRCLNDFTTFKSESDVRKGCSLIDCRCIEMDCAVDGIAYG